MNRDIDTYETFCSKAKYKLATTELVLVNGNLIIRENVNQIMYPSYMVTFVPTKNENDTRS